ncbi:hypothetical protein ACVWXO_000693 [Bradyrhizobium sp. LM2.7]
MKRLAIYLDGTFNSNTSTWWLKPLTSERSHQRVYYRMASARSATRWSVGCVGGYLRAVEAAKGFSSPHRVLKQAHAAAAFRRIQDGTRGFDSALRSTLLDPVAMPRTELMRGLSLESFRPADPPKPEEFLYDSWPRKSSLWKERADLSDVAAPDGGRNLRVHGPICKEGRCAGAGDCTVHAHST